MEGLVASTISLDVADTFRAAAVDAAATVGQLSCCCYSCCLLAWR